MLELSSRAIEKYNDGGGMLVDDVQAMIEERENEDEFGDEEEDED